MVSVCLISYNGEKYIAQQIESILSQLQANDELIISDDGSTDNTINIIKSFKDSRIKLLTHEPFQNSTFNMEYALKHAKGDYIFMSDQDDVWLPNKIEVMKKLLNQYDCVISDCFITDDNLNVIANSRYSFGGKIYKNKFLALFFRTPYQGCCMAMRNNVIKYALPFPKKVYAHDLWIGNVAAFYFTVGFISDKLIYYRRHKNNVSQYKSPNPFYKRAYFRLIYIAGLIKLLFKRK